MVIYSPQALACTQCLPTDLYSLYQLVLVKPLVHLNQYCLHPSAWGLNTALEVSLSDPWDCHCPPSLPKPHPSLATLHVLLKGFCQSGMCLCNETMHLSWLENGEMGGSRNLWVLQGWNAAYCIKVRVIPIALLTSGSGPIHLRHVVSGRFHMRECTKSLCTKRESTRNWARNFSKGKINLRF